MSQISEMSPFYQYLTSMGIGGILAGFAIYMLDKAWKDHSATIKLYYELEKGRADKILDIVAANTHQTAINTTVLNTIQNRLDIDAKQEH